MTSSHPGPSSTRITSGAPSSFHAAPSSSRISSRSAFSASSTSASKSSASSQLPSPASTSHPSSSHRPAVIAAVTASIAAALLTLYLVIFIYRRRRRRQNLASITSQQRSFLPKTPTNVENEGQKGASARSTGQQFTAPGLQRVQRVQPQTHQIVRSSSAKAPHYTVRSHASIRDVYPLGLDMAWQEAHYESPLPVAGPSSHAPAVKPALDIIPPTPSSAMNDHAEAPFLRNHSSASSVPSQYSTASMVPSNPSAPPDAANSTAVRNWLDTVS
ncbi:hypothetical protein B0H17DRAFT_541023 [Mycena rosella]|uniref:Uncharacterized protein n=1 Tax=Mycena rosella TaxID=1033263 RepID=A0AAD7DIE3_MYCRO|nr:hypothetical protein B0H17DRAFT_541023 [Mycena rosella]